MTLENVSLELAARAQQQPEDLAVAIASAGDDFLELTFHELEHSVLSWMERLQEAGLRRGERVVLMVPPSPNFFALTFALLRLETVPVFVDPGMGIANLRRCLRQARPHAFLGVRKAVGARRLLRWVPHVRTVITVGLLGDQLKVRRQEGGPEPLAEEGTAAILFTSGSTGLPKGARYTHDMFCAQVAALRDGFGIQPGERDLSTFPLFALFSPALGMASVVPRMDASRPGRTDPRCLAQAIERYGCTNVFASPALVEILGRHCAETGLQLPSLRRVLSAGAPARVDSVERLTRALPDGCEVHTPYGATESLPVASIGSAELLGELRDQIAAGGGVCVGRPLPGVTVRIVEIDDGILGPEVLDRPLADGEVGEIVVHSRQTSPEYFGLPDANRRAKLVDGQGLLWHRMGDVGRLDEAGRLWMCGRLSHRVSTRDGDLFTIPCESRFNRDPEVLRTALVGVGERPAQRPVLFVEPKRWLGRASRNRLRGRLLGMAGEPPGIAVERVLFRRRFPVDVRHNAKIFRERLADLAARKLR